MAKKEWTLMFYFASDNPLAASIVSQLKSIKQAGFHPEINVIAQFDPQAEGAPTHIFEVNLINKLEAPERYEIGSNTPDVPALVEDRLWGEQKSRDGGLIKDRIKASLGAEGPRYRPPTPPAGKARTDDKIAELSPRRSLTRFLEFCRKHYPARRYILFLLGHGLIVGSDIFLFDEHATEHSLSLKNLGKILSDFKNQIRKDDQSLELVSFHSCSMSAVEVAYELQGTANYMLACEGPAFVGSWPYRQILMHVFQNHLDGSDVKTTLREIFDCCLRNSYDFELAGYSFDLCLCDLKKVKELTTPLKELSKALKGGLTDRLAKECILLAHWDAQSYWDEAFIDIYDFCFRLDQRCAKAKQANSKLRAIQKASRALREALEPDDNRLIIKSEIAGPSYQYSHGLSLFFPWSAPINENFWPNEYEGYKFEKTSWREFLARYFTETMRDPRRSEPRPKGEPAYKPTLVEDLLEEITTLARGGQLGDQGSGTLDDPPGTVKTSSADPTGTDSGPSIKNYPPYTRKPLAKGKKAGKLRE